MKKKLGVCLALACAVCFTAALAACGNISSIHSNDDSDVIVPDKTKVTEQVWLEQANVFATATNFTLDRVSVETKKSVGMMKLDGAVYYEAWGDEEGVYTLESGTYYHYTKADASASWKRDETSQSAYEGRINTPRTLIYSAARAVAEIYSAFTFDEKTGVYSAETVSIAGGYVTLSDIEIIMSGGKIAKVECTYEDGFEGGGDERVTVDHIGTTRIEIPKVSTSEPPAGSQTVDAKAWAAAISASAENFTANMTIDGSDATMTIKVAGDKIEEIHSMPGIKMSEFIAKEGDVYATYAPYGDGSQWKRTTYDSADAKETFDAMKTSVSALAAHFSDFTPENGKYVCDALDLTIRGETVHATEIEAVFTTGRLLSLKYTVFVEVATLKSEQLYTFSNFGTTTVTLPTNYIDDPGESMDEQAWRNAFTEAAENFTLEERGSLGSIAAITAKIDGEKFDQTQSNGVRAIVAKEGNIYATYVHYSGYGMWVRTTDSSDSSKAALDSTKYCVSVFADHHSDFTLKDDKYVCDKLEITTQGQIVLCTDIEASFEEGKLVSLSYRSVYTIEEMDGDMLFTFSDFGTTTVTLPDTFLDLGGSDPTPGDSVDEQTWSDAFSEASKNFTMAGTSIDDDTDVVIFKADGTNFELVETEMRSWAIMIKEGDSYTGYGSENGITWEKVPGLTEEVVHELTENSIKAVSEFGKHYSAFTFQDGKYVCDTLTLDLLGGPTVFTDIVVTFDGGRLVSLTCMLNNHRVTISDFGTTKVEAPTNYTEM